MPTLPAGRLRRRPGGPDPPPLPADLDVIRILDFYPSCGPAGTQVTLLGLHFTRTYPLSFGGVVTGNWNLVSDRVISAIVPEGAVTGPISWGPTGPGGSSW